MNHRWCLLKNALRENMKISKDILQKFGYTPGYAKCRKLSRNDYSHPGLAHSQDCRIRIEAASGLTPCIVIVLCVRQRKMDVYAKEVERTDHPRRASVEPVSCSSHQPKRGKVKINRVFGTPSEPVDNDNRTRLRRSLLCHPV